MGKHLKKATKKITQRQKEWELQSSELKRATTKPGSMKKKSK